MQAGFGRATDRIYGIGSRLLNSLAVREVNTETNYFTSSKFEALS